RNDGATMASFLGGGAYRHHSPAAINQLLLRGEFFTAYTPYQAEVAQGTLQAIFEFQTMISRLFGLDVANASMYDGASATAEAVLMAARLRKGRKVLVAGSLNPAYRAVIETYTQFGDLELLTIPYGADGRVDRNALASLPVAEACAVVVASPNFFGVIEDLAALRAAVNGDAIFVVSFSEPLAYAMLRPPGACGADIAAGEGASFGLATSYGGPYLGLLATKKEFVRSMPGRLAGETADTRGERGYVLTLSTREQHIRREKATSNICTNQALCALAASIYLSLHGKAGLPSLARLNRDLAESAKAKLVAAGATPRFDAPTFNEFVVRLPHPAADVVASARKQGLIPGL
ncbi:MAG: aminomethyl-transferring glycine dehydrogenase subunit GcvPA, partial [Deltaproteobacteria bacterium]|nr:aminomethyl-transferring glycine dehydrogenase subunit GcvPA [Deltaproteobacteria bacterium]